MSKEQKNQSADWNAATWEGHRRQQLQLWSRLSLRQKLEALEEMTELAEHFAKLRQAGCLKHGRGPATDSGQE